MTSHSKIIGLAATVAVSAIALYYSSTNNEAQKEKKEPDVSTQEDQKQNHVCTQCVAEQQQRDAIYQHTVSQAKRINLADHPATIPITANLLLGKFNIIYIAPDDTVLILKKRMEKLRTDIFYPECRLICKGKMLENEKKLTDYKIEKDSCIHLTLGLRGGGLALVNYNEHKEKLIISPYKFHIYDLPPFEISSFHVACKSDIIKDGDNTEDMVGIVLYAYNGKTDWILNNIHCKSGYIVLKSTKNIKHIKSNIGMVHGKCYKYVFNEDINNKVVGGGFAYFNGKWRFNSYSLNVGSKYHDSNKAMNNLEQICILSAINNWKNGIQNTFCKDIAKKYKGNCSKHGFY